MQTLSLIAPRSRNDEANLRSDRDDKLTGSSLVGTVLARRYKILEMIDADSFKAHDLALDQTVTLRRASLTSQCPSDTWWQKIHQLASVRNPHFLNLLDVISDKSIDFVITEPPRGRSIADLLREESRLELEEVLRLVIPLASALDLAASFSCCPNPISNCWLFTEIRSSFEVDSEQRSLCDWAPFSVKLDVWEFVRPKKNVTWPFLASKAHEGGSKGLAVRQTALLTYELLGGKRTNENDTKRWFKPVHTLGEAGNSILYRGLQGSPQFESSGCFLDKLQSAIQSGAESRALPAPVVPTQENSAALTRTSDMIRRFNRDTWWVATAVLGTVIFATLVLAVQLQERHQRRHDLTQKTRQVERDLVLNANPTTLFRGVGLDGKDSTGRTTSEQTSSSAHPPEIYPKEISSLQPEAAASTPTPVLASTPETNHINAQTKTSSWSPVIGPDSAGVIRPKIRKVRDRSSGSPRYVGVKRRLIELWHQSLAKTEKSRSWTAFSKLNDGLKKKAAYTAGTND